MVGRCGVGHQQLSDWLSELKDLRERLNEN